MVVALGVMFVRFNNRWDKKKKKMIKLHVVQIGVGIAYCLIDRFPQVKNNIASGTMINIASVVFVLYWVRVYIHTIQYTYIYTLYIFIYAGIGR